MEPVTFIPFTEEELSCPISYCLFEDPVIAEDGVIYNYPEIHQWLQKSSISPTTQKPIGPTLIRPIFLNQLLDQYYDMNRLSIKPGPKKFGKVSSSDQPSLSIQPSRPAIVLPQGAELIAENKIISKQRREYILTSSMRNKLLNQQGDISSWTINEFKTFFSINDMHIPSGFKKPDYLARMNYLLYV